MRRKTLIIFIVFIMLIGLFIANPTKEDFNDFASSFIQEEVKNANITSSKLIDGLLGILSGKIAGATVDKAFIRKNYYLFSIYELELFEINYRFVGILNSFIPLKKGR